MTRVYSLARFLTARNIVAAIWLMIIAANAKAEPFELRGYYLTFMRMPVMGLNEWKPAVDCFGEDGANVLILWMGGGFASKKFPITWQYNREHHNVTNDFARELIDYAHTKKIKVLLGFTPFGYDGVNQYGIEHPELRAKKADGSVVDQFGIHCWGWNLCAAQPESQRFMREYVSEMAFEFYPNADGLLIESSDYNICRCADCGPKYYEREFGFVKWISEEVWKRKPEALVLVYPHYFAGGKVPGMDVEAARQEFDSRWGLAFSPHSSHFKPELIAKARASIYWSDAPILGTPRGVMEAARAARKNGVTGFVPSMEAFSYVTTHTEGGEPSENGKRRRAFGMDTLGEGRMPYRSLLARVPRSAFREFSRNPDLEFGEFERRLSKEVFGNQNSLAVKELLELQRIFTFESDWYWASPLWEPDLFELRKSRLNVAEHRRNFLTLKEMARKYREDEMGKVAGEVVRRWGKKSP
ncbi:MAG TPA: hypothetical protein VM680_04985 [Verrucomicrobiae bacterium]|nr:hypothetical protein [Verrucomicrobiae bacterium]